MPGHEGVTVFRPDQTPAKEKVGKSVLNHVLIIPDNNRTWARENRLTTKQGYKVGAQRIVETTHAALSVPDLDFLTFHLVSKDNIKKRPEGEKSDLWDAVQENMIKTGLPQLITGNNVRLRVLGDMSGLPENLQDGFNKLIDKSSDNTGKTLSFVIGYDKDQEMQDAMDAEAQAGEDRGDWSAVKSHLYLPRAGMPDVTTIIRAGEEKRTSGIFPHSSADAEHVYYDEAKWPEFTPDHFRKAISIASARKVKGGA